MLKWTDAAEKYVERIIEENKQKYEEFLDYFLPHEMEDAFMAGVKYALEKNESEFYKFLDASGIETKNDSPITVCSIKGS